MGGVAALAISAVPLILTALAFALAYGHRSKASSFLLRGERVEVFEPEQANSWVVGGLGAGLSSLLYPTIKNYNSSMAVVLCVMVFISLYLVFYNRTNIASLRALKNASVVRRVNTHFLRSNMCVRYVTLHGWLGFLHSRAENKRY